MNDEFLIHLINIELPDDPFDKDQLSHVYIHWDYEVAIVIAKNKSYSCKCKHVKLRHDIVEQLIKDGKSAIDYTKSELNSVNLLIKFLARKLILQSSIEMGLRPIDSK